MNSQSTDIFALTSLQRLEDLLPGHRNSEPGPRTSWFIVYHDRLTLVSPTRTHTLTSGAMAILLPETDWQVSECGETLSGFLVQFTGPEAEQIARQCGFSPEQPVRSDVVWSLKPALEIWLRRLEHRLDNPFLPAACAHVLGFHLYNSCNRNNTGIPLAQRLKNAIDYAVYALPTVSELVENFGVSRTTLFRVFKQEYGTSLKPYLLQEQLKRAQLLLWDPRLTVAEIAGQCGYKSTSHFIAAFRNHYGHSPGAWREANLRK